MTQKEMLATIGKDQNFIVHGLLAKAYTEGYKQGAIDARDGAYKAGFTDGVKKAIAESPAYRAGVQDGVEFANELLSSCFYIALHKAFKFGPVRIQRLNDELIPLYDKTLSPAELRERLASFGMTTNYFDTLLEEI